MSNTILKTLNPEQALLVLEFRNQIQTLTADMISKLGETGHQSRSLVALYELSAIVGDMIYLMQNANNIKQQLDVNKCTDVTQFINMLIMFSTDAIVDAIQANVEDEENYEENEEMQYEMEESKKVVKH